MFTEVQNISDSNDNVTVVVVPIERRDEAEQETAYLLQSENTKRRLIQAIERNGEGAVSLESARAQLEI